MRTLDSKGDVVRALMKAQLRCLEKVNVELPYQSINQTHCWVYHLRK